MRKIIAVVLVALSIFTLTSCYGMNEVDEALYVLAIGIDEGKSDKWRVTIQYNTMKSGGSGGEEGGTDSGKSSSSVDCISVDAPSFFAALSIINTTVPRRISLEHTQLIIFSEKLAKKGGLNSYVAPLKRYYELRRSAIVCVSKGSAENIIKNNIPSVGTSLTKNFWMMHEASKFTGLMPSITLETFIASMRSPTTETIAAIIGENNSDVYKKKGSYEPGDNENDGNFIAGKIPHYGEQKVEVCGTAVFKDEKIVAELTGEETRYLLMARGEFRNANITIDDPKQPKMNVPMRMNMNQYPRVKVTFYKERPMIHLDVMLDVDILAIQSMINYESSEYFGFIQEKARLVVKQGIEDVIAKCQRVNADAFKFGDYSKRRVRTIDQLEEYDWNNNFAVAEVFVDVDLFIRRTGEMTKSYVPKK